jgi:hypothetical protein
MKGVVSKEAYAIAALCVALPLMYLAHAIVLKITMLVLRVPRLPSLRSGSHGGLAIRSYS